MIELPENIEQMSLSQMVLSHMIKRYTPATLEEVQYYAPLMVEEGEKNLHEMALKFSTKFLRTGRPRVRAFTNSYDYLRSSYQKRTSIVDKILPYLDNDWKGSMLRIYPTLDPKTNKKKRRDGFAGELKKPGKYVEFAYSNNRNKDAILIAVRRKDSLRAVRKMAFRLLQYQINEERKNSGKPQFKQKRVAIDDWFGIKIVGLGVDQVNNQIYNGLYPNLAAFSLKADSSIEQYNDGRVLKDQPPGVDNHYLAGVGGKDKLIQIKVHPILAGPQSLSEIALTDIVNFLAGEMDHVRFSQTRENQLMNFINSKRSLQKKFRLYCNRGMEVLVEVPLRRRKILQPGKFFD